MKVMKTELEEQHPASHYLVVEDAEQPSSWHLRVMGADGKPDPRLLGAAWAALHGGYRGNKYEGPNKAEALKKLIAMYERLGRPTPDDEAKKEFDDAWIDLPAATAEKDTTPVAFVSWIMPGAPVALKAADKPLHIQVGESMAAAGVKPTKDLYGAHAEEHGSAWMAPKDKFEAVKEAMRKAGYSPRGKGKFARGVVQIDMGQDDENIYLYITDDNGPQIGPRKK